MISNLYQQENDNSESKLSVTNDEMKISMAFLDEDLSEYSTRSNIIQSCRNVNLSNDAINKDNERIETAENENKYKEAAFIISSQICDSIVKNDQTTSNKKTYETFNVDLKKNPDILFNLRLDRHALMSVRAVPHQEMTINIRYKLEDENDFLALKREIKEFQPYNILTKENETLLHAVSNNGTILYVPNITKNEEESLNKRNQISSKLTEIDSSKILFSIKPDQSKMGNLTFNEITANTKDIKETCESNTNISRKSMFSIAVEIMKKKDLINKNKKVSSKLPIERHSMNSSKLDMYKIIQEVMKNNKSKHRSSKVTEEINDFSKQNLDLDYENKQMYKKFDDTSKIVSFRIDKDSSNQTDFSTKDFVEELNDEENIGKSKEIIMYTFPQELIKFKDFLNNVDETIEKDKSLLNILLVNEEKVAEELEFTAINSQYDNMVAHELENMKNVNSNEDNNKRMSFKIEKRNSKISECLLISKNKSVETERSFIPIDSHDRELFEMKDFIKYDDRGMRMSFKIDKNIGRNSEIISKFKNYDFIISETLKTPLERDAKVEKENKKMMNKEDQEDTEQISFEFEKNILNYTESIWQKETIVGMENLDIESLIKDKNNNNDEGKRSRNKSFD